MPVAPTKDKDSVMTIEMLRAYNHALRDGWTEEYYLGDRKLKNNGIGFCRTSFDIKDNQYGDITPEHFDKLTEKDGFTLFISVLKKDNGRGWISHRYFPSWRRTTAAADEEPKFKLWEPIIRYAIAALWRSCPEWKPTYATPQTARLY